MRVSDSSERPVDLFGELSKEQLVARRRTDLLQQIATWPQKTTHTGLCLGWFGKVFPARMWPEVCSTVLFLASSCYLCCSYLYNSHWKSLSSSFSSSSFSSYSLISHAKPAAGRFWPPGTARWAPMPCSWPRSAWSAWTTGWRSASCGAARRGKSRERRHGRGRWRRRCRCGSWCRQRNELVLGMWIFVVIPS